MAENINSGGDLLSKLDPSLKQTSSITKKNDEVAKEEFLTLLVTQLQNQDPMDPLKNDDFAVNLAQFSQLEQLVDINDKLGGEGQGGTGSLATYLGQEVIIDSQQVEVSQGAAGGVHFSLHNDAAAVTVQLLNEDGSVADEVSLGGKSAGDHTVELNELGATDGTYTVNVKGVGLAGGEFETHGRVAGIVKGFIPGPEPVLLVGEREISPEEIAEVRVPTI